jgi:hypothetical protein
MREMWSLNLKSPRLSDNTEFRRLGLAGVMLPGEARMTQIGAQMQANAQAQQDRERAQAQQTPPPASVEIGAKAVPH